MDEAAPKSQVVVEVGDEFQFEDASVDVGIAGAGWEAHCCATFLLEK